MPTRKQRRRRAKEQRHEYVWEDAEGNEIDPAEAPSAKGRSPARAAPSKPTRDVQPPSWRRTFKRSLIFAPIMFVTVMLLSSNLTLAQQVTQTVLIVGIFVPFSYFLDGVFYRSHLKRVARSQQGDRRGS